MFSFFFFVKVFYSFVCSDVRRGIRTYKAMNQLTVRTLIRSLSCFGYGSGFAFWEWEPIAQKMLGKASRVLGWTATMAVLGTWA